MHFSDEKNVSKYVAELSSLCGASLRWQPCEEGDGMEAWEIGSDWAGQSHPTGEPHWNWVTGRDLGCNVLISALVAPEEQPGTQ